VGCFAHARRKFIEVQRAQVKGKTGKADWAISHIRKLYRIESEIKDKDPTEKQNQRMTKANGLTPFDYLNHLLEELPTKSQGIEQLLPWNVDLSKNIKR
jgi:hypothetical protein